MQTERVATSSSIPTPVKKHHLSHSFLQWRKCDRNSAQDATKIYLYNEISQLWMKSTCALLEGGSVTSFGPSQNQLNSFYQCRLNLPWVL